MLKGYPRLSETFIAQEILALQEAGFDLHLISLRHPTDPARHPIHDQITAPVTYLPEYLHQEPWRVLRGWQKSRALPGFPAAWSAFRADLARDRTRNRVRRFGQACVLAAECAAGLGHLHAHFIHTPASVTRYASLMAGLRWTCSAHAKDIWTSPDWELAGKLADSAWTVTCTQTGLDRLRALTGDPDRVHLGYHGLDLERFPLVKRKPASDGAVRILSVGRAVEKKGFDLLLEALARLPADLDWHFTHIGGGEELTALQRQAETLDIAARIDWRGALAQDQVLQAYREADIFALPCRIARSGDRDGLPNVLMEAQSQRIACISTDVSGVGELIENGVSGLLVPPDDIDALARDLERLVRNPRLRQRLAGQGTRIVGERFDHRVTNAELIALFDATLGAGATRKAA